MIEPQIIDPQPTVEGEKPSAAAKEETLESSPITASEEVSTPTPTTVASDLPLAAESSKPAQEAALPSALSLTIEVPAEVKGGEITIPQGDRRYRVRGLAKNMSYELLKVNVPVHREPSESASSTNESGFHVDTSDLYSARQRTVFGKQASEELGVKEEVIPRDLGHLLLKLELQEAQIKNALEPKTEEITLDEDEHTAGRSSPFGFCCGFPPQSRRRAWRVGPARRPPGAWLPSSARRGPRAWLLAALPGWQGPELSRKLRVRRTVALG